MPIQDEFDTIGQPQIGTPFKDDIPAILAWYSQYGLLATNYTCRLCQRDCNQQISGDKIDEIIFSENLKDVYSIRLDSFFEKSHLHIW